MRKIRNLVKESQGIMKPCLLRILESSLVESVTVPHFRFTSR